MELQKSLPFEKKYFRSTLTDFEEVGLHNKLCLADGHAYQELHPSFHNIIQELPQIWYNAARQSIPNAEQLFNKSFASLINSPTLSSFKNFKICPTASNSIDIIAAVLKNLKFKTIMIEPTFDNLALLIKRRAVNLSAVRDAVLFQAAESNDIDNALPDLKKYDALFLVHPNNPTGLTLSESAFRNIVEFCKENDITLILDNCFRLYQKNSFCDYSILIESSVSFIALEDTGKVWPTQDLKASLVYFSEDLKKAFCEIYNEVYLCVSNFSLAVLSAFFDETSKAGIQKTILDISNARRVLLRKVIHGSKLVVDKVAINSTLPVEWLSVASCEKDDFSICQDLCKNGLAILPGRQFYWNSSDRKYNHKNIRVSLMKPEDTFLRGLSVLQKYCEIFEK